MTLNLVGRDLADGLRQVLPAVGADRKRPELHGILLDASAGTLRLVATDSRRLAVREVPVAGSLRAVVAGAPLADVLDWLDQPGEVQLSSDGSSLELDLGDDHRSVPAHPFDFPKYEPFLAAPPDRHRAVVARDALVAAIESLPDAAFARLVFAAGRLTITAEEATETVGAIYDGAGIELAVDPTYLVDAVRTFTEAELAIEATTPTAPVVVAAVDDGSLTYLVMPVRVAKSA